MVIHRGPEIDRVQSVWSCTKSFLGLALGLLIGDGRCSLETRAAEIYPPLSEEYPALTLRHLASFTCGYQPRKASAEDPPFDPAAAIFAPGTRFHYGWGPYLLALVLTKVAGESLRDLFRRRIAELIGLDPAAWAWGDWGSFDRLTGLEGVPVCGGSGMYERGISISARALARVGWLVACDGRWEDRQLVEPAWIRQATAPQVPASIPPHDSAGWYRRLPGAYGFFWWTNGITADAHRLWPAAPPRTFAMQGHLNNLCFIIPEWRMVVIRLGTDNAIDGDLYNEFFATLAPAIGAG